MKITIVAALMSGTILVAAGPSSSVGRDISEPMSPTAPLATTQSSGQPLGAPALAPEDLTQVVQRYCVVCHNDAQMTGDLSLQTFDVAAPHERPEVAEKMVVKLRLAMMPPPGMPRPGGDTLQVLVETLEDKLDRVAQGDPNPGARKAQRINQAEYERVIQDMLDLKINSENWLPPDTYLGSFDNGAAVQTLSTTSLEAYMRAASAVSRLAIGTPTPPSTNETYIIPLSVSQHAWDHVEGSPYGTRGGAVMTHDFPADGEYVFSLTTKFGRSQRHEDVVIAVAGEVVAILATEHSPGDRGTSGSLDPSIRTNPVFVPAGQHEVSASFVRKIPGPYEGRLSAPGLSNQHQSGKETASYGVTALRHLDKFTVSGPSKPTGLSETASRKRVFTCRPTALGAQRACAKSIISRFATQAYRRQVTEEDLAGLMAFYEEGRAEKGFEEGVRSALEGVLSSPFFVFRYEFEPDDVSPGDNYRLDDLSLASRLAFFLWSTVPDAELLDLAQKGRLYDEGVLEGQVRRLLADPRSEVLSTRFAAQWLRLQDLEQMKPEPYYYPDFSRQLALSMRRETEILFDYLVREDRSFLELFNADYTFVDEYLARHYGIPFVEGIEEFQRVQHPVDANRSGIFGQAGILTLTSLANRTSPVLRGKWVMEVLLGSPPPPPPPGVPDLEATDGEKDGRILTTRERMEIHRASPVCNSCHQFMDPIGLALDNFDVTGRWRTRENGSPLDTRGDFYDGTPVSTPDELRNAIIKRPIPLVRTFTQNLFAYATGRSATYLDAPAIRMITRQAEENDYRMTSFILGVVKSDAFQMKRAEVITAER
jgi:hypothetical protein